jgi:hypothetical protein
MADRPAWLGVTITTFSASPATAAIHPALPSSCRPPKLADKFNCTGIVVKMVSKTTDITGPQAEPGSSFSEAIDSFRPHSGDPPGKRSRIFYVGSPLPNSARHSEMQLSMLLYKMGAFRLRWNYGAAMEHERPFLAGAGQTHMP